MNKMILAGIASVALASAAIVAPTAVAARSVISSLTTTEHAAASQLAETIVKAVMSAQGEIRGLSAEQAKLQVQLTVQMVIRNSAATPTVAAAAVEMAQAKLAADGVLDCIRPPEKEQSCNPSSLAMASLSTLLSGIVETAPAVSGGANGAIPLGAPVALTPPNSGSSDYRGS